jgi:asparagine synthase (glutamine-hydrolysing)
MDSGSMWTFEGGRPLAKRRYFRPETWAELPQLSVAEYRERLSTACREAVRARFESDSRIGISITGGLDTRMIMACLPSARHAPLCYTFAGIEGETLDVRLGRQVAQECGLEHRTLRVGPDFLRRYGELVDRTVFITDGYAGALGAHEIYLNALAKQVAPVRVTGNFGSEVLRGMSSKPSALAADLLLPEWREKVAACGQNRASLRNMNPVVFAVFHEIASIHFGIPAAAKSQLTLRTPFVSNEIVELAIRAPASERWSPAACASLIAEHHPGLAAIPTDRGVTPNTGRSSFGRRLFTAVTFKLDYLHKEGLPPALRRLESALQATEAFGLLGLHKYLPYRTWLKNELADHVRDVLNDRSVRQMPWWNTTALDRVLADHSAGRRNNLREINAILTLASVHRTLIRDGFVTHDKTGSKGT